MTPKEKAKELFDKMTLVCDNIDCHHSLDPYIKQCVSIAVDEILEVIGELNYLENGGRSDTYGITYWQEVKVENKPNLTP